MDDWNLDTAVKVSISIKTGLEIAGFLLALLGIYTKLVTMIVRRKPNVNDEINKVALTTLARKNDKIEYEAKLDSLTDKHEEALERARKEAYSEGEKEGHEKGYEVGKVDATRGFRLEFADFLIDEASRIRGQVEDVDRMDLPPITTDAIPLPKTARPLLSFEMEPNHLPSPHASGLDYYTRPPLR